MTTDNGFKDLNITDAEVNRDKEQEEGSPAGPMGTTGMPAEVRSKFGWAKALLGYLLLLLVGLSSAIGYKGYTTSKSSGYHYDRSCTVPETTGLDIKGTRRYLNQTLSVFGYSFMDTSKANEATRLDSTMVETTIVGIKDGTWWSLHNPAAEPKVMILKEADTYVFTQGSKSYVVTYEDFCK